MKIANNLKKIRQNMNLSQEEVAKKCGICTSTYIDIEKGKSVPKLTTALLISKVLQENIHRLFTVINEKDEQ